MRKGYLHSVMELLWKALLSLKAEVPPREIEYIAVLVHNIMCQRSRLYHSIEHVFSFLNTTDPIVTLAAIFHDLIYLHVDEGLPPEAHQLFAPYLRIEGTRIHPLACEKKSETVELVCTLFGRSPERIDTPIKGINEFLSGLTFSLTLGKYVSRIHQAAVLLCIEATIPFRGTNEEGKAVGEVLFERSRKLFVQAEESLLHSLVERAIQFGNQDVMDFANLDTAAFLSNTWKLLPETNQALLQKGAFTIKQYRKALQGMLGFFRSLNPETIYHSYRGKPDTTTIQSYVQRARKNLTLSIQYLRAKLLATAVLEALAELTGGDAPMALFMGDADSRISEAQEETYCITQLLPEAKEVPWIDETHPVVSLLRDGRLEESSFDLRNSPLALWLYRRLRPEEWRKLADQMEAYFAGNLSASQFLSFFPKSTESPMQGLLGELIQAGGKIIPTRREAFDDLLSKGVQP
ncbi:MAG: hypothetical protein SNJ78_01775 [Spirochaetales bacterium]